MKILVIGDLHGKNCWETINDKAYDKVIFMGDYVDSFTISDEDILQNLKKIIDYRKKNQDKVVLLLGNHDVQYMHYPNFLCSGFRESMLKDLSELFINNASEFQVAWYYQYHLFTHAGLTKSLYDEFLYSPHFKNVNTSAKSLVDVINEASQFSSLRNILYKAGASRGGKGSGGILWADKRELAGDLLSGFHQIVGHTPSVAIETFSYNEKTSATFVDVLDRKIEFYELEITDPAPFDYELFKSNKSL